MADTIGNEPGFWDYAAGALGPGYGPSETRSRFKRNQLQDALVNQFMEEQKAKQEYLAAKAGGPTGLAMQDIDALNQETMTAPRFDGKRVTAGAVGRVGIPDELRDNAPLEDTNIAGMKAKLQANPNQYSGNEALAPVQADQLREQIASAPRRFATAQNERLTRAMPDEMIAADVERMTPKMQVVGKNIVRLDGDKATEIYKGGAEGTWQQVVDGDQAFKVRVDEEGNEISKRIPLGLSADARQMKIFAAQADAADARAGRQKPPKIKTYFDSDGGGIQIDENDPDDMKIVKEKGLTSSSANSSEQKARGYLDRLLAAEERLQQLDDAGYDPSNLKDSKIGSVPLVGNYMVSDQGQSYNQKKKDWARAKLRLESGATIGDTESDEEFNTYFASPGDSPMAQIDKERSRLQAQLQLATEAGPLGTGKAKEIKAKQVEFENIVHTAKLKGMTVKQVRDLLKKKKAVPNAP